MGRLIDADKFEAFIIRTNGDEEFINGVQYVLEKIDNTPTVEAIPKDQYEARLKADMVAILTEIQLEIEEKSIIDYDENLYDGGECVISISEINEIIQDKINALEEKE